VVDHLWCCEGRFVAGSEQRPTSWQVFNLVPVFSIASVNPYAPRTTGDPPAPPPTHPHPHTPPSPVFRFDYGAAGNGVWCEGRKEDWFCTHIGWRPLRTASALASLLHLLVSTCVPPLLHMPAPLCRGCRRVYAALAPCVSQAHQQGGGWWHQPPCSSHSCLVRCC